MFGKKTENLETSAEVIEVTTLPKEFYGGIDPAVHFKKVDKEVDLTPKKVGQLTVGEKKALDKATAVGNGQPLHPVNLFSNRKFLIVAGATAFLLFIGGAGWYYYQQALGQQKSAVNMILPQTIEVITEQNFSPINNPEIAAPTTSVAVAVETSAAPTTTPVAASLVGGALIFPGNLLGDSVDTDRDGLTDVEEELFKTDPNIPDTDGDGFLDGSEIYHLYSPIQKTPIKLVDSGLVKEYNNSAFGYSFYYPTSWAIGVVDTGSRDVLFSTLSGENVEVRVFDKINGENFNSWFAQSAFSEKLSDLSAFTGILEQSGQRRNDNLVYYFEDVNRIYVLVYHPGDLAIINYRLVIEMMAQSFRLVEI